MSQLAPIDGAAPRARAMAARDVDSLVRLGRKGRLAAYRTGHFTVRGRWLWARHFPEEVPVVNGELEWIALGLADLD
jgi:hypothetical protein